MHSGRLGNVTGALLLGGASTRMGRDKAHLDWAGEAWSTRAACLLDSLFDETLLVGGMPPTDAPGRRVEDPDGSPCALLGLVAALEAASCERVAVIATDLPLLSPELLLALTAWPEHDAVVPCDSRGDHPLCAIYRREVVGPIAREQLSKGERALFRLLARLDTARVTLEGLGLADLGAEVLANVNTPDDLAQVASLAERAPDA